MATPYPHLRELGNPQGINIWGTALGSSVAPAALGLPAAPTDLQNALTGYIPLQPVGSGPVPGASDTWRTSTLLPMARDQQTGQVKWAVPNALTDAANALAAPGNALMGKYNQVEIGPDDSVSPFDPRMVSDASNLAGLVTLGAGAAPIEADALSMGFRSRNADGLYHRYTPGPSPDNGAGLMMFGDDPYTSAHYGAYHHTYDGTGIVDASKVANAAKRAGFEKEFGYGVDQIDPEEIVNSAGAWDDPSAVRWLWEKVLEPKGWHAVSTNNGAIVFNPDLVKSAGMRDE